MATAALQSEPATVPSIDSLRVARPHKDSENYNPYLAARHEWDERYGSLITRERNWRIMALFARPLRSWPSAACSAFDEVAYRSVRRCHGFARPHHGRRRRGRGFDSDDRLKRATLFNWVEDLRTVTVTGSPSGRPSTAFMPTSPAAPRRRRSSASSIDPPRHRSAPPRKPSSVEVRSVLPTSERTFEVEWMETTRDLYGAVKGQDHWKARSPLPSTRPWTNVWPGSTRSGFT